MRIIPIIVLAALVAALTASSVPPLYECAQPALVFAISFRLPPTVNDTLASATEPPELATMLTNAGRAYDLSVTDASSSAKSGDAFLSVLPQSMGQGVGGTLGHVSSVASGQLVGRAGKINRPG